jgi:hypothetical protein
MLTETTVSPDVAAHDAIVPSAGSSAEARAVVDASGQILQVMTELRLEVSALRGELLGQNQQMLSRIQFLHEGLIGRIKQMREPHTTHHRRRPVR